MKNESLFNESNRSTYTPEDNKLRLYVGRVPRPEYEALRAEGWTSTPKQGCDFVAVWNPERRDTALSYSGIIEDEDQSPAERAADRAERFGDYRDKRTAEATGHADRYDSGPAVHGYQSAARAERAAGRHDRLATYAVDAWSKAEYWQQRTAGVISHALHVSSPGVRMGRIKTIEAELRRHIASFEKQRDTYKAWKMCEAETDPVKQKKIAQILANYSHCHYKHPVSGQELSLYRIAEDPDITGAQVAQLWLSDTPEPKEENDWSIHYRLRLAYENQMLQAQGGRLEQAEVLPGGKFGGKLILKVNKSTATGRATSVSVLGDKVKGYTYKASNFPGTEWAEHQFDLERYPMSAYTPPTHESLEELAKVKAAIKAARPEKESCPLVNPTDQDAEKLQAFFNANLREGYEPSQVERMNQATYSNNSGGTYASCETITLTGGGRPNSRHYMSHKKEQFPPVCKVRVHGRRVVILTDKPQKPFPAELWNDPRPAIMEECKERAEEIRKALQASSSDNWTPEQKDLIEKAVSVGFVNWASMGQFSLTDKGWTALNSLAFKKCDDCGRTFPKDKWEVNPHNVMFSPAVVCPGCDMQQENKDKAALTKAAKKIVKE